MGQMCQAGVVLASGSHRNILYRWASSPCLIRNMGGGKERPDPYDILAQVRSLMSISEGNAAKSSSASSYDISFAPPGPARATFPSIRYGDPISGQGWKEVTIYIILISKSYQKKRKPDLTLDFDVLFTLVDNQKVTEGS